MISAATSAKRLRVSELVQPGSRPTFSSFYFFGEPSRQCGGLPCLALYHSALWLTKDFLFLHLHPVRIHAKAWAPEKAISEPSASNDGCADLRLASCLIDDEAV
jgi:hypothetical protein